MHERRGSYNEKAWRIKQVYNLTKTASSRGLHFPLFRRRWLCSTWTHGKLCWKPRKSKLQKSKIISVLDIIKDMGKEEITFVQYRLKCHRIFTLKKMLKAIKTFSIWNWARHALHVFCTRSRKYLKDQNMRQPLVQLLPKASFGLRVLSLPASVCVCVRACASTLSLSAR